MKRIALTIACSLLASTALAQLMMMGVENSAGGPTYLGPGNVVSGAQGFWSLRAYNTAWATGHNHLATICTPSDAICDFVNSDNAGNFNIAASSVSGCNNSGTICTVKILNDQSGFNNCTSAPCDVTNATPANRPILVVPGAANGCTTTSNFCMSTSDATQQSLCASSDFTTGSGQPFSISVVYKVTSRNRDMYVFDSSNFGSPALIPGFSGANLIAQSFTATPTATAAADGAFHAVQSIYNLTSSDVVVDGAHSTGFPLTQTAGSYSTIRVCLLNSTGPTGGANSLNGFSTEFGIWPSNITSGSLTAMNTNQHGYWGF